ncbi:hypothetical protein [Actinomadura nitritigenes]|uniref:hypothetical protein n=1 Tax=Actinomadura nitritigenes TaxID=134602 RepID=UPI003D8C7976
MISPGKGSGPRASGGGHVAIALYAGTAFLLEDTMHRTVLPVARRKAARSALEGDLSQQVQRVTQEAGVREQL